MPYLSGDERLYTTDYYISRTFNYLLEGSIKFHEVVESREANARVYADAF